MKSGRGAMSFATSAENVTITRWMDNNVVHVVSSFAGKEPVGKAKRYCKASKASVEVEQPYSVAVYNKHMGGVDLMDSLVGLYRHNIRNKKWYMRIFYHMLNVAVINAWILWRKSEMDVLDLLEFKSRVATGLIFSGEVAMKSKKRGRPSKEGQDEMQPKIRKNFWKVQEEKRFDGGPHYPKKSNGKFALKCKSMLCQSKTRYKCGRCEVHLCPECFESFHTK